MYEMICAMAGVRAGEAGWGRVRVAPHVEAYRESGVSDLKGRAVTPKGDVEFAYTWEVTFGGGQGGWRYWVRLPQGLEGEFVHGDGSVTRIGAGGTYEERGE